MDRDSRGMGSRMLVVRARTGQPKVAVPHPGISHLPPSLPHMDDKFPMLEYMHIAPPIKHYVNLTLPSKFEHYNFVTSCSSPRLSDRIVITGERHRTLHALTPVDSPIHIPPSKSFAPNAIGAIPTAGAANAIEPSVTMTATTMELVPRASWKAVCEEKAKLEEELRRKEKRMLRLRQVFAAKTAEFREALSAILGVKIAIYDNGQVRVTSRYDLGAAFVFQPAKDGTSAGAARMQLVAQGEGGSRELPPLMRNWARLSRVYRVFLASVMTSGSAFLYSKEVEENTRSEGGWIRPMSRVTRHLHDIDRASRQSILFQHIYEQALARP